MEINIRIILRILIGLSALGWWIGACYLQILDIYPYNYFLLYYSSFFCVFLAFLLAVHDWIKYKSLNNFFDFYPDIAGSEPTIKEWFSKKVWRSAPKWYVAVTIIWVIINFSFRNIYSFPNMEKNLTETINNDEYLKSQIGKVKGYGYFRGGLLTTNSDSLHLDLTIRVYGQKGNFPLEVTVDKENIFFKIKKIEIL